MNFKLYFLVVLCIVLFGCEHFYDENGNEIGDDSNTAEYKWGAWGDPELISIADDSLAVLAIYRRYFKEWKSCGLGCIIFSETADRHVGLFLVNYREKQKPVWGDTLEYNLAIVSDYFKDSSVLVFDRKYNKFGFWKIGTKKVEFVNYDDYSGIENREYISYNARQFANGNIFLFSYPKLFLLEVESRQLKPFEFFREYEWLYKCANGLGKNHYYYPVDGPYYIDYYYDYANVSYIGGELSCIRGNEMANNFELTVNNIVMDTSSLNKSFKERITGWYGNYVKDVSNKVYKIDTLNFKFDSTYIPMWLLINGPSFYKNNQNGNGSVRYTTQDLLEVYK